LFDGTLRQESVRDGRYDGARGEGRDTGRRAAGHDRDGGRGRDRAKGRRRAPLRQRRGRLRQARRGQGI